MKAAKNFLARRVWLAAAVCLALGARAVENHLVTTASFSKLNNAPLYFEANASQAEGAAPFVARGIECSVLLSASEAEIILGKPADRLALSHESTARTVRLKLLGANPAANMSGLDRMAATANYFIGSDRANWHAGVPMFSRVQVAEVYPGVSVIYYANQSAQLEYDFQLQAGANPAQIRFGIEGADSVRVDGAGNLVLNIGGQEISQHKPVVYQEANGVRKDIAGDYQLNADGTVGFSLGAYDRSLPLTIDPALDFLTYVGGKQLDIAWSVALDSSSGNIFVAGETLSTDLPTTNALMVTLTNRGVPYTTNFTNFQGGTHSFGDAFVASYDSNGVLRFLSYLGGKTDDGALGIASDGGGGVWLTGFTDSTNFPITTNALFTKITGQNNNAKNLFPTDAFISHLDKSGTNLDYSTYFGGADLDEGVGIAVLNSNQVFVTGLTGSTNFPVTPNAAQTNVAGSFDAFVTELWDGTNYYTTLLGGTNTDFGLSVAVDSQTNAWVTGFTYSTNFPTTNVMTLTNDWNTKVMSANIQFTNHLFTELNSQTNSTRHNTGLRSDDAFVAAIGPSGTNLLFSTYLGGSNDDVGNHIAVDPNNDNVFVTGYTFSRDFPTNISTEPPTPIFDPAVTNIVYPTQSTNFLAHVFVTAITNYHIGFSTQFGGNQADQATAIAVDNNHLVYVFGSTSSTNFFATNILGVTNTIPILRHGHTNGFTYQGILTNNSVFTNLSQTNLLIPLKHKGNTNDLFLAVLDADGTNFVHSIILGGPSDDEANAMAVDPSGSAVYIVGATTSNTNFVTTNNAAQPLFGGGKSKKNSDGFVGKISLSP
jgi:hypothetical protein